MQTSFWWVGGPGCALCIQALVLASPLASASAQVNSWINPSNSNWHDSSNWSLGVLPTSPHAVMITNSGWKAVGINPETTANFPASLTVDTLTIRGTWDTYNTLLLNFAGTAVPLTVLSGLTVA